MAPLIEGAAPVGLLRGQLLEGLETEAARSRQYHHLARDAPRGHRLQRRASVAEVGQRTEYRGRVQRAVHHPSQGLLGNGKRRPGGTCNAHPAAGDQVQRETGRAALRHAGEHVQIAAGAQERRRLFGSPGGGSQQHNVVEPVTRKLAQLPMGRARRTADVQQVRRRQPQGRDALCERRQPWLREVGDHHGGRRMRLRQREQNVHLSHRAAAAHEPRPPAGRQSLARGARVRLRHAPVAAPHDANALVVNAPDITRQPAPLGAGGGVHAHHGVARQIGEHLRHPLVAGRGAGNHHVVRATRQHGILPP